MVELKRFLAIYLSVIITVTLFALAATASLQIESKDETTRLESNHFSVTWMGFSPTDYSSDYPEYYICINNLKDDPLTMQIALQIKNQEDSAYYFKVDQFSSPPAGWSILPMAVGLIDVDETLQFAYKNVFRSRPASISEGRLTESINLVVQAYYDPGYTSLYSQDDFTVVFNFLDLTSANWAMLYHDDFDDGTTQGWVAHRVDSNGGAEVGVSDTYYRSFQYSLRLRTFTSGGYNYWSRAAYRKTFDIGVGSEVYLIYSLRSDNWNAYSDSGVQINGTTYFKSDVTPATNTWYQFAVKLKPAQLNQVDIWVAYVYGSNQNAYAYLEDVYIIAK